MVRTVVITLLMLIMGLFLGLLKACGPGDERFLEPIFSDEEVAQLDFKIDVALKSLADEPRLQIGMSFVMPRDELIFKLPDVFLRKEKLYQRIENLQVLSEGSFSPVGEDDSFLKLLQKKGSRVQLSYLFRPNAPGDIEQESFSAPIIRKDYFQFVGLMAFMYPVALIEAPTFSTTLSFHVPEDFQVFNSYGAQQPVQKVATDFDKLRDSFFMAGNQLRVKEVQVRNKPVLVTFEGDFDLIADDEFTDVVSKLLATQRATWQDDNFPYFLVHFLSAKADCTQRVNFAGTAHPNSLRAFFPSGCRLIADMKQLISHELMHMWIGKKIKVGKERGHIDGKWLTEGFTDYFGRILAYRAGVISEDEYFGSLNRQLQKYYASDERTTPLKSLVARMYRSGYSSRNLEDIPYQQGEIMAWRLNQRIKTATSFRSSLDSVVLDMLKQAQGAGGSKNFTVAEIERIVDVYAPDALNEEFAKVEQGKLFAIPPLNDCRTRYVYPPPSSSTRSTADGIIFYGGHKRSCARWLK